MYHLVFTSYHPLTCVHGVVLSLRAGVWKSGIFRFTIDMPDTYPGNNSCPKITFLNQVFHQWLIMILVKLIYHCVFQIDWWETLYSKLIVHFIPHIYTYYTAIATH